MKHLLLLLALNLSGSALLAQNVDLWSSSEISSRGAVRMSELLRTLGPLRSWSSDRYSLRFQGIGLGGAHSSGPVTLVDGIAMPFRFMDRELYEMLPVSPADIDSISYDADWTTLSTGQHSDGVIRITTLREQGFSIRGTLGLTNETGDPGPAIYLDTKLRNVDRSGPTSAVRLSFGHRGLYVQAGIYSDSYHVTDGLISRRVWRVFNGDVKPVTTSTSPHIRVAYRNSNIDLDIWAGRSLRNDFLYDEIAGWEWPSRQDWKWLSARAAIRVSPLVRVGGTSNIKTLRTNNLPSSIDLPNSMLTRDVSTEAFLELQREKNQIRWTIGGRITDQEQFHGHDAGAVGRAHSSLTARLFPSNDTALIFHGFVSSPLELGVDPGQLSTLLSGRVERHWVNGGRISVSTSYRSVSERDVWSTLDHVVNGMHFEQWSSIIDLPGSIARVRTLDAVIRSVLPLSSSVSVWIELRARQWLGLTLAERRFERHAGSLLFRSDSRYQTGRSGRVYAPSAGVLITPSPATTVRIRYQFSHVISDGDTVFWQQFTGLAPHRLTGSIMSTPTRRLHVFASFEVGSPRLWPQYSRYWQGKRPWVSNIEGTVLKDLWRENLKIGISILNLANTPSLNYPAGVVEQLAVRLSLSVRFSDRTQAGSATE